ncbi:MAG: dethiobiotin synthase [Bacteroidota bacterium]|nr:dethiobiotin synthase [Bacteroidota bacterium]MDP3146190.1 dethiobiotin synthase [Bacteroidota bacterium]
MNRYFITGIGTDVGKTIVSAVLTEALKADYWKPLQCGISGGTDKDLVSSLISNTTTVCHKEGYCFDEPVSPHLAASLANQKIKLEQMHLPDTNNNLIIEGAGGIMVPLNDSNYVIDLAQEFEADVILVCRNYLGCINHSLLSIDYLVKNNFPIKGLVLVGNFDKAVKLAITNYSELPLLAEIPEMTDISKESIFNQAQKINLSLFED